MFFSVLPVRQRHTDRNTHTHTQNHAQVWCNHSLVFHPSQAAGEYKRIAKRTRSLWNWFLTLVLYLALVVRKIFQKEEDQGMNCLYGTGEVISYGDMEKVRDAMWKNTVFFPYERGDVTMLDNSWVRSRTHPRFALSFFLSFLSRTHARACRG